MLIHYQLRNLRCMENELYVAINLFTLLNLLIFSSILIFRPNNSVSNYLLALVILDPGLNFLNNIIILTNTIFKYPVFLFLFQGTALLYGILVYAYVNSMIGRKFKWLTPLNIITLLALLIDGWFYIEFLQMPTDAQNQYLTCLTFKECYPYQMNILNAFAVSIWMAYFVKAYIVLRKHISAAKNYFSDIDKIKVTYLKAFLILVISLNMGLAVLYSIISTAYVEYLVIPVIVNIVNLFILYYAFQQNAIFNITEYCTLVESTENLNRYKNLQEPLCKEIKELMNQNKMQKYRLTQIEIEENYNKIINYMETAKPHLDPKINLTKFSSDLGACSHTISLTLNTRFKMNFFDFINYYRVEEVKKCLSNIHELNIKIEAIGYECGFNSKSAFYRAFKKFTGFSPTEYLEKIHNQIVA